MSSRASALAPENNEPRQTQTATGAASGQASETEMQNDIARLAYTLWLQGGCQEGSAERDWLEAEQKLRESSVAQRSR